MLALNILVLLILIIHRIIGTPPTRNRIIIIPKTRFYLVVTFLTKTCLTIVIPGTKIRHPRKKPSQASFVFPTTPSISYIVMQGLTRARATNIFVL
jgi:hypothetical protein